MCHAPTLDGDPEDDPRGELPCPVPVVPRDQPDLVVPAVHVVDESVCANPSEPARASGSQTNQ
jgi:hypothetical protein